MAIYKCLVNGSIDDADRTRVAKELERVTTAHFGKDLDGVRVEFVEVEPGSWFTGGNPSAASMVLGSVPTRVIGVNMQDTRLSTRMSVHHTRPLPVPCIAH
jgi:phenylpyruvate tautomerase PptA (4-oxalocrotonate tautomerase family)